MKYCLLFSIILTANVYSQSVIIEKNGDLEVEIIQCGPEEDLSIIEQEDTIVVPYCGDDTLLPPPEPEPLPPPQNPESIIYDFVDNEAQYPGGSEALMKDLQSLIVYPDSAIKMGIQGKVYVSFVIEVDGSISQIEIMRGIGYGCDEAAIQALKGLKNWIPANIRGKNVRQRMRLPVIFRLD